MRDETEEEGKDITMVRGGGGEDVAEGERSCEEIGERHKEGEGRETRSGSSRERIMKMK